MNVPPFKNEPYLNFREEHNARAMSRAIEEVERSLGRSYGPVVAGVRYNDGQVLRSVNPSRFEEVVGSVHLADRELADQAVKSAWEAFGPWSKLSPEVRAGYLLKAAAEMRRRKLEFNAWLVLEVGKTCAEAEGETAEAIDFMEFYAREAIRYGGHQPITASPLIDEINELTYLPLGVGLVVPPWNFPLAILAGMTTAAIVAGNTVVLKPSSDSPVIAAKFIELLEQVGVPAGVVNFLPAKGGEVGDFLVDHPRIRFISFTGSKEVGLRINERAARHQPGQIWIKRVVAEMGGKDAIVVDETACIDDAVSGIVASAFGFSGQKCSACSRAIIVDSVYDAVVSRIGELTQALRVGPAKDLSASTGPVVSAKAFESISRYLEIGASEGRTVCGGTKHELADKGWYLPPTVFADVSPRARIAQEEIFGPVLAVIRARNFDDALAIANDTEFGLTGSLYSNDRERLLRAKREFHVGNLYLNRKCTGALVGVHPFGGFNLSGTDSKAGGRDYLGLFLQAKSIAEKY